jgi:capsular polysaccharide biosynthesis protein
MPHDSSLQSPSWRDVLWRPRGFIRDLPSWAEHDAAARGLVERCTALGPETTGSRCYVAALPGGKVVGELKLVATADDRVIADLQFLYGSKEQETHWVLRQRRLRRPERLAGTAALLAASNGDNYYHWMFDSLPRLKLLEQAGYGVGAIDHFLLKEPPQRFQLQGLEQLGIPPHKLRPLSKRRLLQAERLLVPSMPGPLGEPTPWICRVLREQFLPREPVQAQRKIYVSRRHAQGRKIVNEDELLPMLAEHGYDVVFAERLSFREQVDLFASATRVIAPHGAGMSNIVFAPRGAKVLELCSPLHNNACFSTLAASCGQEHHYVYLQAADGSTQGDTRFANLKSAPEDFRAWLARLG